MAESIVAKKKYKPKALKPIPTEKYCKGCDLTLPASDFYLVKVITSTGRDSRKLETHCSKCKAAKYRLTYQPRPKKQPHPATEPKKCAQCKQVKTPDQFEVRLSLGQVKVPTLSSWCRDCKLAYARRLDHRDRIKNVDKDRAFRQKHADRYKRYAAKYFQAHKEEIRIRNLELRKLNPAKTRVRSKAAIYKRRARGCDARLTVIKDSILECLESYRIGDMYWDVYDSALIATPTIDHIVPVSKLGANHADNLTVTSLSNNSSKGNLPLLIWMAKRLHNRPLECLKSSSPPKI